MSRLLTGVKELRTLQALVLVLGNRNHRMCCVAKSI